MANTVTLARCAALANPATRASGGSRGYPLVTYSIAWRRLASDGPAFNISVAADPASEARYRSSSCISLAGDNHRIAAGWSPFPATLPIAASSSDRFVVNGIEGEGPE